MTILNKEIIQALREQKGWDQRTLAEAAGINPSVISRVERGLQEDLRLSVAVAIASALDVSVDTLLATKLGSGRHAAPEFEAVITELLKLSEEHQRQAAGILRGYLNVFR